MSYYSNPTANKAIGSVDSDIRRIQKVVAKLHEMQQQGKPIDKQLEQARRCYVGLFRQVFENELAKPPKGRDEAK